MKLKAILSIFVAFSLALSSCDKKNAKLVNRRRKSVTTSETGEKHSSSSSSLSDTQQRGKDLIAKITKSSLSATQQRGKDLIAKITKNLQFRLERTYYLRHQCYINIEYNDKKNKPFIMYEGCYYGRRNSSDSGGSLTDAVIDGHFRLILDFDNQDCIRNNAGGGQGSDYNLADTDCCIVVEVAGARFVKEEKVPPITVTMSYYNSSAPSLRADFQETLTLNSGSCPTGNVYTWQ
ncbi:hypothetical protein AGMMS50233_00330 [Endomicrobiia bacterium]|nr:hypothetical protein AGMMS50233_00330 [Endomicrobiia bacterium]